ncbi:hypothetical protein L1887_09467 [Cichorium endivia]|nr:hypothetical protein L1887_09467 [Cichorium endivia]
MGEAEITSFQPRFHLSIYSGQWFPINPDNRFSYLIHGTITSHQSHTTQKPLQFLHSRQSSNSPQAHFYFPVSRLLLQHLKLHVLSRSFLTNLLQYHDAKVFEHASVCLTRIVEAFAASPDKLDELCNHGLVTQAASFISTSSSRGSKTLLLLGISGILKDILSCSDHVASMYVSPALSRPPEQVRCLLLICTISSLPIASTSERNFGMFKADGSVSYGIGFTGLITSSATFVF